MSEPGDRTRQRFGCRPEASEEGETVTPTPPSTLDTTGNALAPVLDSTIRDLAATRAELADVTEERDIYREMALVALAQLAETATVRRQGETARRVHEFTGEHVEAPVARREGAVV